MKIYLRKNQTGFTLIELLIYIVVSAALVSSMYQIFYVQQKSYILQNHTTEMQQNLRSGMYLMTKDLRSVAYNPSLRADVGFVTSFDAPNDKFVIDYATSKDIIAFTTDTDEDSVVDANEREQIAYRFNQAKRVLERFKSTAAAPGGDWETVLDNVDAVNFVYLKGDGTRATLASEIRLVEVALLVRARQVDAKYENKEMYKNKQGEVICATCTGDNVHRRLLTTTVQARNIRS